MRRRAFISLLGGAAAAWPLAASAQQPERMRRIGVLLNTQENDPATQGWLDGFQQRLRQIGWVEDRTIRFERRYAGGDPQRRFANIAEIVGLRPDVILAQNTPMVAALRRQTDNIPIVFVQVSDPVGDGFVESLAHPGGNTTGFANTVSSLGGKWVELLKEAAPGVSQLGYLFNRAAAPGAGAYYLEPLLTAAAALGMKAVQLELRNVDEIDSVIAGFAAAGGNGMVANSDSFITVNRNRIIAAANRLRLPTMYSSAQNTNSGGLISYGADQGEQWYAAASYVDRILRGAKPRDLPVQSPAKFILSINIKTAKAIGLDIPWFLQQRADEVIE
jgi:putative tryptophan/tyrosine transport system substrate-binding protein